jgi:DNA-binding response OmpR family regulator
VKILIVEDEKALAGSMSDFLTHEGFKCETAFNFFQAQEKINLYRYDCIIVDITLPDGNGFKIIEELKLLKSDAGIIIVSARNTLDDRIRGLDTGADDYLTKPFHLTELNARVKSILRRRLFEGNNEFSVNEITINPEKKTVLINDKALILTKKEYDLLIFFLSNKNRVLTKESIAEHLWGDNMDMADSYDFIYTHMKNLRKKMLDLKSRDYIQTVYGMGYKFDLNV